LIPLADLTVSAAYLLVFHGSKDPRSQAAAVHLTDCFRETLASADPSRSKNSVLVQVGFLECCSTPLSQQIIEFAELAGSILLAPWQLVVLPVFLLPGVHVMEDVPGEVARAQEALPSLRVQVQQYLGAHPGMKTLLAGQSAQFSAEDAIEHWILLAHGSRRVDANQPIATLAESLQMTPAYWSVAPQLESCLQAFSTHAVSTTERQRVGIMPYFLFPGGMTDAIAQAVVRFALQFPNLQLTLTDPLNANPNLVKLLLDWALPELQICPHPPTPSPKKGEGEPDQSPSPALGEGFRVRAAKLGSTP
jgi:sirohydrochlorin cobaltochelatase